MPPAESADEFVARVLSLRDRLTPQFPDIDPGDLLLIVTSLLRPPGSRKHMFLRTLRPGVYVF